MMSERSGGRWLRAALCVFPAVGLLLALGFLLPILLESSHSRHPQREGQATVWLRNAEWACNRYRGDFGEFPPAEDSTELVRMLTTETEHEGKVCGPYMHARRETPESEALDPWRTPVRYERSADGRSFKLGSAGPDGTFGTDDDIWLASPSPAPPAAPTESPTE